MVETELFAQTYKSHGLATVRYHPPPEIVSRAPVRAGCVIDVRRL
jgi:hypothetical protein